MRDAAMVRESNGMWKALDRVSGSRGMEIGFCFFFSSPIYFIFVLSDFFPSCEKLQSHVVIEAPFNLVPANCWQFDQIGSFPQHEYLLSNLCRMEGKLRWTTRKVL